MNILNNLVGGAISQFGREFGRAGANMVLKGANSYTIKGASDYTERIKPSDSEVVKSIKEVNKITFVAMNKANVSRLIELTNIVMSNIQFEGNKTLNELNDITELISRYNDKFDHGSALVDDDFKDKSVEYLEERRVEFVRLMAEFNSELKSFIVKNLEFAITKKKSKKTAALFAIPLLGLQWAYLNSVGFTILSVLLCWTIIVPIINLVALLKLVFMSEDKFDLEFNPEYVYYSQFNIKN